MSQQIANQDLWGRFKKYYLHDAKSGFGLDITRMFFNDDYLKTVGEALMKKALPAMQALVSGAIANPTEGRQVGHYWLRNVELAPEAYRPLITKAIADVKSFAAKVQNAEIRPPSSSRFTSALIIGIGGSALGPQFVNQALGTARDPLKLYFFDNTDPDGMNRVLDSIPSFESCLCVVISKSGGTKETRNGQMIAKEAFRRRGLEFSKQAVAITGDGSELDKTAVKEGWLARFPMWDWIGGRTSELSAVGLLPAALQGIDIDQMLAGARHMDQLTLSPVTAQNPAALLALMWYHAGCGKGLKDMVVLPYKDRLELFSRYLQQLVMESLGKEKDVQGTRVLNQGIAVYGNKGATDQHAYVQQLRDGINNFFVVFINVLKAGTSLSLSQEGVELEVEPGVTAADYLSGFLQGTRGALFEHDRESLTITISEVNPFNVGMLIALFERAVAFYASFIDVNAYDQPGVEAGKKAAAAVLSMQGEVFEYLRSVSAPQGVEDIHKALKVQDSQITLYYLLQHLAANGRVKVESCQTAGEERYSV